MEQNKSNPDEQRIQSVIDRVTEELRRTGLLKSSPGQVKATLNKSNPTKIVHVKTSTQAEGVDTICIDLQDPTTLDSRSRSGIANPASAEVLGGLMGSTPARIGVGRAGARYRTATWLLFQADHAVTQDALLREVDVHLLERLGFFSVQTRVSGGKQEYLLRPDLGRQLNEEAIQVIRKRCVQKPDIQICAGDGLSAAAIEANLEKIYPVMLDGFQSAGLKVGTPFFIRFCRVGVMNDIGDVLQPDVLILLIGERPGLGRAESMSAYMAYQPHTGHSDANRDVICNIYDTGGTNPLEGGAYVVQMAKRMLANRVSGVQLRLAESAKEK